MSTAEERIKGHLPKAMRSAVQFSGGQVTCDWDERTVCMNPENTNRYGSVQVVVDTPRQHGVERIAPGGALPRYVIWDLNNPTE